MKLIYTDEAFEDLKRLREFFAIHNPSAAARIATELVATRFSRNRHAS